jgi:hypothetical protein
MLSPPQPEHFSTLFGDGTSAELRGSKRDLPDELSLAERHAIRRAFDEAYDWSAQYPDGELINVPEIRLIRKGERLRGFMVTVTHLSHRWQRTLAYDFHGEVIGHRDLGPVGS